MNYYVSEEALETYNKIFGTSLASSVDGGLTVTMPTKTLEIFSSGEVVMTFSSFAGKCRQLSRSILR